MNLELLHLALQNGGISLSELVEAIQGKPTEPQCTCTEFQKQRALCPVCDKEEFKKNRQFMDQLKQVRPKN